MLKELSIEIIRKCPQCCLHCSSLSDEHGREELDFDCFVAIVRDAATLGAETICLSGGEPFLHPRLLDMVKFISSLGLQSYIYTSGITFDEQHARVSLDQGVLRSISSDVTKLIFNIEAANAATYDVIMGSTACFEQMQQSVRNAVACHITSEAHFVPMKLNIGELREVLALCQGLGVSKLSFLRLVLHGRAQQNAARIALTNDDLLDLKRSLEVLRHDAQIDIRIGVPLSINQSCQHCEAANGKLTVKYDGKVLPCEAFKSECPLNDLEKTRPDSIYATSLREIYLHSPYLQIVRELGKNFADAEGNETCIGQYLMNIGGTPHEQK